MKAVIKVASVVGGVVILSEIFGMVGEAQAFSAMHHRVPDEVGKTIKLLENPEEMGVTNPYKKLKAKIIADMTKTMIDV